tara:strand:- start:6637 stop:6867 length:231 start_codon:yes stop_codon:yes gene_type:complete
MATAQVAADKKKAGMLGERDAGGFVFTAIGGVNHYTGQGAPDHAAVKGSVYMDTAAAEMYICTVASGTWKKVTRAS